MKDAANTIPDATRAIPKERARGIRAVIDGPSAPAASLALPGDGMVRTIRVRALTTGFYGWMTRRENDVFDIAAEPVHPENVVAKNGSIIYKKGDPVHFSPFWMEKVSQDTDIRITTGPEQLRKENEELLAVRRGQVTGDRQVLGQ